MGGRRSSDAARGRYGLPAESVVYLGEDPARDPKRISGRSTREAIAAAVDRWPRTARPGDRVFIVLIGHGASATGGGRFNLPGPDLTAAEFATLLDRLAAQTVVFVNTASASGGFVEALAGKDRTSSRPRRPTARGTRRGSANTSSRRSPRPTDADTDKDGRVSVLEAFTWARARIADSYNRDGQLLTEHAVLDDNGDGKGADAPGQPGGDGALARTLFLSAASASRPARDQADPGAARARRRSATRSKRRSRR